MSSLQWYTIKNLGELDSPAFVVYPDRIRQNIRTLIGTIDDVRRLRPHVKTHKSSEVAAMMLEEGLTKFKCATIAEAEMLAEAGAKDILIAYQPVGPKVYRLSKLVQRYPGIKWACLIDDLECAKDLSYVFEKLKLTINVYIDLNVGMDRTGIAPQDAFGLFDDCTRLNGISIVGLHAYDGHLRDPDYTIRKNRCDQAFANVLKVQEDIQKRYRKKMILIAGGTPTYSIHSKRKEVECSPGTYIYWDRGYETTLTEQKYLHAALVLARVVSVPAENTICVDLGHKSIAAENPIQNRVFFLNASELQPIGHSEEHMVFKTTPEKKYKIGDVLYGVPFHICPTVALYDVANVVTDNKVTMKWHTVARQKAITI